MKKDHYLPLMQLKVKIVCFFASFLSRTATFGQNNMKILSMISDVLSFKILYA